MVKLVVLACLAAAARADPSDPNLQRSYSSWSTAVKDTIMANYDKETPPESESRDPSASGDVYSLAGTDVHLKVTIFKLDTVDVPQGTMRMKVWLRYKWTDMRLAWNSSEYGGITKVHYLAAGYSEAEISRIWLPDIAVYNAVDGLSHSFDPSLAEVSSDGQVLWTRPGMLELMCRFSGLTNFPSDRLKCGFDVGGWYLSGAYQGLLADGEGYSLLKATLEATRMRLRPILMTSLAFGLGVTPLMLSTGAGSGARNAIGTGVFGGVVAATVLAIFFIPLFYALVRRVSGAPMTGKKDGSTPLEDREAQP